MGPESFYKLRYLSFLVLLDNIIANAGILLMHLLITAERQLLPLDDEFHPGALLLLRPWCRLLSHLYYLV